MINKRLQQLYVRIFIVLLVISFAAVTGYLHRTYLQMRAPSSLEWSSIPVRDEAWPYRVGDRIVKRGATGQHNALSEAARVHADMGIWYEKSGVYGKELSEYSTALKYNPSDALIRNRIELLLGLISGAGGHKPAGGEVVEDGGEGKKKKAAFGEAEGGGMEDKGPGGYRLAVEELNKVLKLVPSHMDTKELVHLSNRAAEEMGKAVVESHQKKGIDYFLADEMESAIKVWDAVLKLDPDNKTAIEYKRRAETVVERLKEIKDKNKEAQLSMPPAGYQPLSMRK